MRVISSMTLVVIQNSHESYDGFGVLTVAPYKK